MSSKETCPSQSDQPVVVIVGPCASGKTTLANALLSHGIVAHVVGQEHSGVSYLWERRHPDVVIALDVDLASLRQRRSPTWPADLYQAQHERLKSAYAAATVLLDTSAMPQEEVLMRALEVIREHHRA